jgi:hypothetical protein
MCLVGDEIGQHVPHVKREVPPYVTVRRRDRSIRREPELQKILDAGAAPFQRGHELPGRRAVVIHASSGDNPVLTAQRLHPTASGIVKVRSNRANRTLRRAWNDDIPHGPGQMFDQLDRDPVVRAPGRKKAQLHIARRTKPQVRQLLVKELEIVLRHRIRVMAADGLGGELSTSGALAGAQARDRSRSQCRRQAMPGLLERATSYFSHSSEDRRRLPMSASPFEFHSEQAERLNLVPFRQPVPRCLATLRREPVEKIDGGVVPALFRSRQRFSHFADEPAVIQSVVFAANAACFLGTCTCALEQFSPRWA